MQTLNPLPPELQHLKNLKTLYYCGDIELLKKRKIAIIGSRNPNPYAQSFTKEIAKKISPYAAIISGGALGIDILAHNAALPNTIMVSPSSLDIIYPKTNQKIIQEIYKNALILSQFPPTYIPKNYSFLERNKIIISLAEYIIIPQADLKSGSMESAKYALSLGKKIYVPPHQLGQSKGTQTLAKEKKAEIIWDIDEFLNQLFEVSYNNDKDEVLEFCKSNPFFEEAFACFGEILFHYELEGKIQRNNGRIEVI